MEHPNADPCIVHIPVPRIIRFLQHSGTLQDDGRDFLSKTLPNPGKAIDWHRFFRQQMQAPLHLNLGIPGIEEPGNPIEENPECLAMALLLGMPAVPVILSGELEQAVELGLLEKKAMSNLRNRIRVSV